MMPAIFLPEVTILHFAFYVPLTRKSIFGCGSKSREMRKILHRRSLLETSAFNQLRPSALSVKSKLATTADDDLFPGPCRLIATLVFHNPLSI